MKHFVLILGALAVALVSWWLIEIAELSNKQLVGGFLAAWIGFTFELVGLLLLERNETKQKIETIKTGLDNASEQFKETKAEATGIQHYVSSLGQNVVLLEQSIKRGLLATALDDPANVWRQVLEDACKSKHSIYVAITAPNFSAPKEWDELLSDYLKERRDKTNEEIPYIVAIYRPKNEWSPEVVGQLRKINDKYRLKSLQLVTHGFVEQSNYFRFNVVTIDRKSVGFLWNSKGGAMSTKGIYFREAPDLAGEMTEWFLSTCKGRVISVTDIPTLPSHESQQGHV
jgi:hypothetical protein